MEEKDELITCEFCQSEFVELTEEGKMKHNEVDSQGNSFHSCFSSQGQDPDHLQSSLADHQQNDDDEWEDEEDDQEVKRRKNKKSRRQGASATITPPQNQNVQTYLDENGNQVQVETIVQHQIDIQNFDGNGNNFALPDSITQIMNAPQQIGVQNGNVITTQTGAGMVNGVPTGVIVADLTSLRG